MTTRTLHPRHIPAVQARVAKLAKRAAKLGLPVPEFHHIRSWSEECRDDLGRQFLREQAEIEVTGDIVKVNGWTLVAVGEVLPSKKIVVRTLGEIPAHVGARVANLRDLVVAPICEHCNTKRRRSQVYLLAHEDGSLKQVGKSCLQDFLGVDPAALVWAASLDSKVGDEDDWAGASSGLSLHVRTFLFDVANVIRVEGWLSRGAARERGEGGATADIALSLYAERTRTDQEHYGRGPTADDGERTERALEWIKNEVANSDYIYSLQAACEEEFVHPRLAGIIASLFAAHDNDIERKAKRAAEDEARVDEWFGEIKKRELFTLTLRREITFEGDYGTSVLHIFVDEKGREAKWFASNWNIFEDADGIPCAWKVGDTHTVKATIKKHDLYNGRKSTALSRVAAVKEAK